MIELAKKFTVIAGALAALASGLSWAWKQHNAFLMDAISPMLRASYVSRINNYRKIQCMQPLTVQQQVAYDEVMADYESLVGRPIGSNRDCDSL